MRRLGLLLSILLFLSTTFCFGQSDCVYTAGFARDANGGQCGAYWKSGRLTKLSNGNWAEARTIAVSGSDVFVGGFKRIGTNSVAAYWKNGQEQPLSLEGNYINKSTQVYAIKTVGSDVYMFVSQPDGGGNQNYFYYYKNGKAVKMVNSNHQLKNGFLGTHGGYTNEHFFVTANGDVYEIGAMADDYIAGTYRIVYWKNGRLEKENASEAIKTPTTDININSLFVATNGDVYMAGTKTTRRTTGSAESKSTAFYLKNGKEVVLSYDAWNTYAKSIFVENGNVYVAGDECKTFSHFSAVYWKNGQKIILQNYDDINGYDATCTSIAVVYGTVYASGSHKGGVYWVNGKEVKLEGQASTQFGGMAVVKGGGCFNNTTTITTATSPGYQSNNYNNQVKPQQQSLTEDVKQLATGISGLMASIKADKERRLAEEKQAAIAKRNEERQTSNDADNGVYDAQIKMAEKYFGESRYNLAQDYYFQAFQNKTVNNDKRNDVLDELITTLSLLGKKKEIFELVDYITTNKIVNYNVVEILNFLRLNCGEFCPDYLNCNDSTAIINVIKEIKPNTNSWFQLPLKEKDALFAYYQVTGKYEKYGIPKDEKQGLKALEKIIDSKYIFSQQECAYYYLGLIYLNGASTIDVNEKKALKYFKKGYDRPEKVYQLAPAYSTYDARKAYFNYHLLNYIQIAALYSKSEDKEDSELGRKMLKAFYTYYKAMIPQSDMEYFKEYFTK